MSADRQSGDDERDAHRPGAAPVQPEINLDDPSPTVGAKLAVGLRLQEYEISGVLGEGGFGVVYLAWDHALQRRLAIKEYMPTSLAFRAAGLQVEVRSERDSESFEAGLRSFVNEAKLLARFDHPSLLKVLRFWQANGTAYMAMPYYEGPTLKQALAARSEPPDEAWLRQLLVPLLDALEYLHAASCYHRDIAPDNILLIDGGRPLLLDFGAARRLLGDMAKAVTVILKAGYAPVEQYGETPGMSQGPWTDIYALGAVLHFAITGARPRASVSRLLGNDDLPLAQRAAGRYSAQLLRAIDQMLAVQPKDRPQSVAALRALIGSGEEPASPIGPRPLAARRAWRPGLRSHFARMAAMLQPGRLATRTSVGLAALASAAVIWGLWHFVASPTLAPILPPLVVSQPAPPSSVSTPMSSPVAPATDPAVEAVALPASAPANIAEPAATPPSIALPPAQATVAATPASPSPALEAASAPSAASGQAPTLPALRPNRQVPAADRPDAAAAVASPGPRMPASASCTDIIQRVSIGETLTAADRRILKEECGR